jgi:parallel beta-helix repeat protein
MKSKLKKKASIIIVLGIFFAISSIYYCNPCLKATSKDKSADYSDYFTLDRENLKISAISGKIHIDNNWTAAKAAGICTGEGTYSEPYIIEDLKIDGGGLGSCIWIENSTVYFEIKNCRLYNAIASSWGGAIYLINVSNGYIVDNQLNNNGYVGINLVYSNNNTILRNDVCNQGMGLLLQGSHNTLIEGNTFNNNSAEASLLLFFSANNTILENSLNFNHRGIGFWYGDDNIVTGNFFKFNVIGIYSYECSYRNTIYRNCFSNNSIAATDMEGASYWDNGTVGNYWSDYNGVDSDENGIGDTPYNITHSSVVTNQDNFPLMKCPLPVQKDNGDVIPIEMIIIISVISGVAVIGVTTLLLIIRKRKRIE